MAGRPLVSIVVACRNESRFIEACLRSIGSQTYPKDRLEVVVIDGASEDDTVEIVQRTLGSLGISHSVFTNEARTAPVGFNIGVRGSRGDVVIIVGAHSEIESDYVSRCIDLLSETGADVVGGVISTEADGYGPRGIALALSSPIAVGGVAFRTKLDHHGPVDTVPFGAYRRDVFDRIGLFDETFVRNQDDELNYRITVNGGTIWMDPRIRSRYFARSSLRALWKQYFDYGSYKWLILKKHRALPSWRHWVPGLFVLSVLVATLTGLALRDPRPLLIVVVPYVCVVTAMSAWTARRNPALWPVVVAACMTVHSAYGTGFLTGPWRWRAVELRTAR